MLKLLEWSSKQHDDYMVDVNNEQSKRIHRTRRFKNEATNIDVALVDYSDVATKKRYANYETPETAITDMPSLEVDIHHYRPGGFSPEAHEFYKELYAFIESVHGSRPFSILCPTTIQEARLQCDP